jgi:urease accessory protein
VRDEASAGDWLVDQQLHLALARADLAVVGAALEAFPRRRHGARRALDAWVRQTRETSELRQQTEQMGRSLGEWHEVAGPPRRARPAQATYPVAFAHAAADIDARRAPDRPGLRLRLGREHDAGRHQVRAARARARPAHPGSGWPRDPAAVDHALSLDDDARQAFTPHAGHPVGAHETQYSRLFRS